MNTASPLLQPLTVGPLTLKNRVMFPPMTTGYEERDGAIGPRSLHFYERLAKGGVGYIVLGDVAPVATLSPTPRLNDDRLIPSFRALAETLHRYDCKLGVQIFHPEYDVPEVARLMGLSRDLSDQAKALEEAGDSAAAAEKRAAGEAAGNQARARLNHDMKHFATEVTPAALGEIREAMARCARRAQQAGVDAIEVHGDRLLGSLCSPLLNRRTDSYGGSFEHRVRYALEGVAAIRATVPGMMIEYKLPLILRNQDGSFRGKGGLPVEEAVQFARLLEKAGVDMIQAAQANHTSNKGDTVPPMGSAPFNWTLPAAAQIKAAVSIPVATVGRVPDIASGEEILQAGKADVIGYGRSLLCDPDIANKAASGEPLRRCIYCNTGCMHAITSRKYVSCVLNAENGDEEAIFIRPGQGEKDIAVLGAGLSGLEAARVAALRGYRVSVWDTAAEVGGQILQAAANPARTELLRCLDYYRELLPRLGVALHLGETCPTAALAQADAVIAAVGPGGAELIQQQTSAPVYPVGDCVAGKRTGFANAIRTAYHTANQL